MRQDVGCVINLLDVVHLLDRIVGGLFVGEADEAEATATTGVAVLNNNLYTILSEGLTSNVQGTYSLLDLAILLELSAESAIVGVPCEATA